MPKTEEGDFELLIGNKQLLTVFFVVVILLGVFFTMGYIVGKNSVVAGDAGNKEKQPKLLEPPTSSPQLVPPAPSKEEHASAPPAKETEPEPVKETPKPATKEVVKADPAPSKAPATPATKEPPGLSGTYLQISAPNTRPSADVMANAARTKGFSSAVIEIPGNVVRYGVLVGPIPTGEIGKKIGRAHV